MRRGEASPKVFIDFCQIAIKSHEEDVVPVMSYPSSLKYHVKSIQRAGSSDETYMLCKEPMREIVRSPKSESRSSITRLLTTMLVKSWKL